MRTWLSVFALAVSVHRGCHAYFHHTIPVSANSCGSCSYREASYWAGWWTTASVVETASIEAVTVLVLTDDTSSTTRTTTIFNFPPDAPLSATNSDGYALHTQTFTSGTSTSTAVLTWPTGYVSYQQSQVWHGTLPIAEGDGPDASTICSTAPDTGTTLSFSSPLPVITTAVGTFGAEHANDYNTDDYYLWTFYTGPNDAWCSWPFATSYATDYYSAAPNFPVYQTCWGPVGIICPPQALSTQAYLTVTRTTAASAYTPPSRESDAHIEHSVPTDTAQPAGAATAGPSRTDILHALTAAPESGRGSQSRSATGTARMSIARPTTTTPTPDTGKYVASGIGLNGTTGQTRASPSSSAVEQIGTATRADVSASGVLWCALTVVACLLATMLRV